MNRLLIIIIFPLICLGFKDGRKRDRDENIPVLAWYSIPPDQTSLSRYLELKDAGISINLSFFNDAGSMAKALDIAKEAGIRMIVYCPELLTATGETVKKFRNHPAVAGYMLRDEPNRSDFGELANMAREIIKYDRKHFCYLNLFPNYATDQQLGTKTYQEYVDQFVREVPVQFISFDHYPVLGDSLRANWYENLEIISEAASKAGKPFWAFALSVAHGHYPVPSLPQLRLQVYSDLAYGAQCVQYFTYWTPVDTAWNFNNGPMTADGKRTVVYDRIREVNKEIESLSFIFSGARVISVAHTGKIPEGTKPLTALPGPVKKLATEGTGAVVANLQNGNMNYMVIVNRDFMEPMILHIKCEDKVKRILKDGTIVPANDYLPDIEIDPGDIAIYAWQ